MRGINFGLLGSRSGPHVVLILSMRGAKIRDGGVSDRTGPTGPGSVLNDEDGSDEDPPPTKSRLPDSCPAVGLIRTILAPTRTGFLRIRLQTLA